MEITLNININAPALVDLIREAMQNSVKPLVNGAAAPAKKEPASDLTKETPATGTTAGAAAPSGEQSDAPKPPKRRSPGSAPIPPAATAAPSAATTGEASGLTREQVKARLSDYSADKRYGMDGVFKILAKYGVQRISDLPEKDFVAFKTEIDEALAAPVGDPLS